MKELAEYIFSSHSYGFRNFKSSIAKYTFIVDNQEKQIVFCRMTFVVIYHNLGDKQWKEFCLYLQDIIKQKYSNEEIKTLDEYKILRTYSEKMFGDIDIEVIKRESPDFLISLPNNKKIGVEITRLVDEIDAITYKIASDNFGRGRTTEEIRNHAISKYPKMYDNLIFRTLSNTNRTTYIAKREMTDVTEEHRRNAVQIMDKYIKFQKWSKEEHFDHRLILCVAYRPIHYANERDLYEVADQLFSYSFDIDCEVVIFSYLDGISGFWGIIDLINKKISYYPEEKRILKL